MKIFKNIALSAAACLAFAITPVSHASVIFTLEAIGTTSTLVAGTTTIDFEGLGTIAGSTVGCPYVSCSGAYQFRENNGVVNQSAAPFMATPVGQDWLTVPNPNSNGSATFMLSNSYNYFGLFWGSIDTYNTLQFYNGASLVGSFAGSAFSPALNANGNQGNWNSNRFINFYFTGSDTYNKVKIISDGFAFETDNHAFGNVPEPTTLALLGLGLAGLGLSRRKKI